MSDCDYTMCGDMDCADCYPRREVDRLRTVLAGLAATVEALEAERDDPTPAWTPSARGG